jgi:hypothetical protein
MEGASGSIGPAPEPGTGHQIYIAVVDPDGQVLAEPLVDMRPSVRGGVGMYGYGEDHAGAFIIEMRTDLTTGTSNMETRSGNLTGRRPHDLGRRAQHGLRGLGRLCSAGFPPR